MTSRLRVIAAPALIGLVGVVVLAALSVWQVQRLGWKQNMIARLEARLGADPVPLPAGLDPAKHAFLRVSVAGRFGAEPGRHGFRQVPFLTISARHGPGYRIIQPFTLADGRRIMVDRGFMPAQAAKREGAAIAMVPAPAGELTVVGSLRWPEERADPPFGASDNVWIARDLARMAELFGTDEALLIAETDTRPPGARWPEPAPLREVEIRNEHLNYAITWALLGIAWAVLSLVWARRELRRARNGG